MRLRAFVLGLLLMTGTSGCYLHGVLLDVDRNPETGCELPANDAHFSGILRGIDAVAFATVFDPRVLAFDPNEFGFDPNSLDPNHIDPNMPLLVGGTIMAYCSPDGDDEGDPFPANFQFSPVGINNGINGSDVIEFSIPRSTLPPGATQMYAHFLSSWIFDTPGEVLGSSTDLLGKINDFLDGHSLSDFHHQSDIVPGNNQGFLINLQPGSPAPALSYAGLALLTVILLMTARKRLAGPMRGVVSCVLLLGALGVAYAAVIKVDGQVPDWSGISPLGTDAVGDSSSDDPAEDIVATFVTADDENIYFRVDVNDAFAGRFSEP